MKRIILYSSLVIIATMGLIYFRIKMREILVRADENTIQQFEETLKMYEGQATKITDTEVATKQGVDNIHKGEYDKAVIVLEQATKLDENYLDAAFYLGYAYLKRAAETKKYKGLLYYPRKLTYDEQRGDLLKAKEALLKAQKIDPLHPMTNKLLGFVCEKLNDKDSKLWYARYKEVTSRP